MLPRPCVDCGVIVRASRCKQCQRIKERGRVSRLDRGYDYRWRKLSKQLREIHPFCKQCGATKDLTVDHIDQRFNKLEAKIDQLMQKG